MNYLIFLLVSFFWGISFFLMKKASLSFSPLYISSTRVVLGALALGVIWLLFYKSKRLAKKDLLPVYTLALIGYVYPFCIQPYLIARYDSSIIGMIVALVPIMTILVSLPMLRQVPNRYELIGVIGGFAFTSLLIYEGWDRQISPLHILLWATVPLSYATGNTYVKKRFAHIDPLVLACCALIFSAVTLLPVALTRGSIQANENFSAAVLSLLFLGLVCTGLMTFIFYKLIYRAGPLFGSMVGYLIPCFAVLWGWLDGEQITLRQIIALSGILVMVFISQKKAIRIRL